MTDWTGCTRLQRRKTATGIATSTTAHAVAIRANVETRIPITWRTPWLTARSVKRNLVGAHTPPAQQVMLGVAWLQVNHCKHCDPFLLLLLPPCHLYNTYSGAKVPKHDGINLERCKPACRHTFLWKTPSPWVDALMQLQCHIWHHTVIKRSTADVSHLGETLPRLQHICHA